MFDREQAIADWRRKLTAAGIWALDALDELESHLRDDVDALLRTGIAEQQAFETAVARIGNVQTLEGEFNREYKIKDAVLLVVMILYFLASGIPVLLKLFSFSDINSAQQRSALAAMTLTGVAFFAGRRLGQILPVVSKRVLLVIAGAGLTLFLLWQAVFYHYVMTRAEWDVSQLVVAILWAMMPASFFSIHLGMEEGALGRTPKTHV